jgi:hypothetical protein
MHRLYRWLLVIVAVTLIASPALAATTTLGANEPLSSLQTVVSDLYSYSLKLVGLCVFVMFLIAGLTYIIPGLQKKFGDPWDIIKDAIIGLVLLFSAYLILNTINPDLVGGGTASGATSASTQTAGTAPLPVAPERTPLPPDATVIFPPLPGDANHNGVYILNGQLNNDDTRKLTVYVNGTVVGTVAAGDYFTMSRLPAGTVTYTH